jgi:hypothetical protein
MALVILGGLMTSLCLVLMILPALIWRWRRAPEAGSGAPYSGPRESAVD